MKIFKLIVAGAAVAAVPMTANAGLVDFKAAAANERGIANGAPGETIDGVHMNFTSDNLATAAVNDAWSYLDTGAGLGVCRVLGGDTTDGDEHTGGTNECKDGGDDNIQVNERVSVTFDHAMDISGLLLNAEGHGPLGNSVTVVINGLAMLTSAAQSNIWYNVTSMTFDFGGTAADQYYVSAMYVERAAPAPAALGLFGLGLAGLGFARRRRS